MFVRINIGEYEECRVAAKTMTTTETEDNQDDEYMYGDQMAGRNPMLLFYVQCVMSNSAKYSLRNLYLFGQPHSRIN